jgi:hypothetical protein
MRQEYRATRKEPFGDMLRRIYEGLGNGGLPVKYRFTFADAMVSTGGVSVVARAVKEYPHLGPLVTTAPVAPMLKAKQPERTGRPRSWGMRKRDQVRRRDSAIARRARGGRRLDGAAREISKQKSWLSSTHRGTEEVLQSH